MTVEIDDSPQIAQHSETRPALNESAGGMVGVHGGANAQPYSSNALPASDGDAQQVRVDSELQAHSLTQAKPCLH